MKDIDTIIRPIDTTKFLGANIQAIKHRPEFNKRTEHKFNYADRHISALTKKSDIFEDLDRRPCTWPVKKFNLRTKMRKTRILPRLMYGIIHTNHELLRPELEYNLKKFKSERSGFKENVESL